jgi:hypothetical protein
MFLGDVEGFTVESVELTGILFAHLLDLRDVLEDIGKHEDVFMIRRGWIKGLAGIVDIAPDGCAVELEVKRGDVW